MAVEISGIQIASWTPVIKRGAVFQIPISFLDAEGDPDPILSAKIVVIPNGSAQIEWTEANGLFDNIGVGQYATDLNEAYTAALVWDSGRYRIEIVDSSGFTDPCITEGLIFAEDCFE